VWTAAQTTSVPGIERLGVAAVLVVVLLGLLVYERRRADRAAGQLLEITERAIAAIVEATASQRATTEAVERLTDEIRRHP